MLIRIGEAAKLLEVNPETMKLWDKEGLLKANRVGIGSRLDRCYDLELIKRIEVKRQRTKLIPVIREEAVR